MTTKTTEAPKKKATSSRSRGAAEPAETPVRTVNGLAVIEDAPQPSALPTKNGKPTFFPGYRVLTLEDKSTVYGCGECPNPTDFTGTRGEIQKHRVAAHGMRQGGARPRKPADQDVVPASIRAMTIDELLITAAEIEHLGDLVNTLTEERDEYRKRTAAAELQIRRWERTFTQLGLYPKENEA